jgi:hypothetical protein
LEVPEKKPTYEIQKQKIGEFLSEMLAPEIYEILFSRDSEIQRNFVGDTTHVFSHIKQSLHVERFRVTPKNSEIFAIIEAGDANGGTGKKKKGGKVVINLEEEEEWEGRKEEVAGKRRGRKKDEEDEDEGEEDEDEEDDKKRGKAEKSPRKQSLKKKSNLARAKTKSGSFEIPMKWVSEKEIIHLAISKGTKKCFALEPEKAGTTGKPKKTKKKSDPMKKSVRRAGNNQSPKKKDLGKSQPKIDDMFKPKAKK